MAATSQPYRHNNAITAFTIWGNTFAGSRWGRINSLGRATYGRLPLNSQGVPSKLPLAPAYSANNFSACSLNSPPSAPPSAVPSGPATAVPIPTPTSFSAYFRQFVGAADMAFILTNSAVLVRHSDDICLIPR